MPCLMSSTGPSDSPLHHSPCAPSPAGRHQQALHSSSCQGEGQQAIGRRQEAEADTLTFPAPSHSLGCCGLACLAPVSQPLHIGRLLSPLPLAFRLRGANASLLFPALLLPSMNSALPQLPSYCPPTPVTSLYHVFLVEH